MEKKCNISLFIEISVRDLAWEYMQKANLCPDNVSYFQMEQLLRAYEITDMAGWTLADSVFFQS